MRDMKQIGAIVCVRYVKEGEGVSLNENLPETNNIFEEESYATQIYLIRL